MVSSQPRSSFSVITFNVNRESDAYQPAISALSEAAADLVCLQENTAAWDQAFDGALADLYPQRIFRPTGGPGGMGFLSRCPVLDLRKLFPPPGGWFDAWLVQIESPLGPLCVLNVHLRPPYLMRGGLKSVPFAYSFVWAVRLLELVDYTQQLNGRRLSIIAGDFNEGRGLALWWIKCAGMRSAVDPFDSTTPSWSWQSPRLRLSARLDHIFHRPELTCVSAGVLPPCGSDHRPVRGIFELSCRTEL